MVKKYRYQNLLFIALLLAVVVPLFILAFYSRPAVDDYLDAVICEGHSAFFNAKNYYLTWTGRYFGIIVDVLINPLLYRAEWANKYISIFFVALFSFAAYWLSKQMSSSKNKSFTLGMTALIILSFICWILDLGQSIFWQTGVIATLIPNILSLFMFGSIIAYYNSGRNKIYLLSACLSAIGVIGCYEVSMLIIDMAMSVLVLYKLIKKQDLIFPITLLAVCIIFSLVSVLAPGNFLRSHYFPKGHQLGFTLVQSTKSDIEVLLHWMPHLLLFMGFILFDLVSEHIDDLSASFRSIFSLPLWISFTACLVIPFVGISINYWAQGIYPQFRTANVFYFYFMLALMYCVVSCSLILLKRYPGFKLPVYIKIPCYILFAYLTLFRSSVVKGEYSDLYNGTAAAYSKQVDERNAYLLSTKDDSCMVAPITQIPVSFYYLDIQPDHRYWLDMDLCKYYHKKYIGLK